MPTTSQGSSSFEPAAAASGQAQPSVAEIETALRQAQDLNAWWSRVEAGAERVERFTLYPAVPGSEPVWGFFGEAPVLGRALPVMGTVVDNFFDQPRVPPAQQAQAAQWMLAQIEEFALHYWLRVQASALPEPYPELGHGAPAPYLSWLSLCFPSDQEFSGNANLQQQFKLRGSGRVGEFPPPDRAAVIDLRELATTYEWITVETTSFDFNVTIGGAGDEAPSLVVPLTTTVDFVTSAGLTVDRRNPEPGTLAAYGPGFGFVKAAGSRALAVAPDMIQPGLRLQSLRVLATGETRFRGVLILPRPDQIVNLSTPDLFLGAADVLTLGATAKWTGPLRQTLSKLPLPSFGFDPVLGSMRLFNLLTGNRAAETLCISQEQVEKEILAKSAQAMSQMALAARQIWLQVPDWLDSAAIPLWARRGEIA